MFIFGFRRPNIVKKKMTSKKKKEEEKHWNTLIVTDKYPEILVNGIFF